jgi:hypothetical protein
MMMMMMMMMMIIMRRRRRRRRRRHPLSISDWIETRVGDTHRFEFSSLDLHKAWTIREI